MENTKENKKRFFAQYYGLYVFSYTDQPMLKLGQINHFTLRDVHNKILELTPLSLISDEDAIDVAMLLVNWKSSMSRLTKINVRNRQDGDHAWDELIFDFVGSHKYCIRYRGGDWLGWIDSNGHCEWTLFNHLKVYDYLRKKGYAIPFDGISVEQQVEWGWVKLKTE